ncbi:alpha/beta hydrolase [Kribbella sp. NPDC059898]|uniref:alpha/beta hydrolase n=1 Tax=Kribbella sp. NPDC059898 TaxID=3346995 RepID=UPI0036460DB3
MSAASRVPDQPTSATHALHPEVAALLALLTATAPTATPADSTTVAESVAEMRKAFDSLIDTLHPSRPPRFDGAIEDLAVPVGDRLVATRVYRPGRASTADRVLVFAHGGGWVLGDLDAADPHVRRIATHLGAVVVSVDYRMAPGHPFPAGFDDCVAVHRWVARTWSPRWLGVAGDSAGGNLAAAMAIDAAIHGTQCEAQLLFYPALDPTMSTTSHEQLATGYLLDRDTMAFYWHAYLSESDGPDRRCTPTAAADSDLARAAPAVITTAGYDPLKDEGRAYAERLSALGVKVTHVHHPDLIHGWLDQADLIGAARDACSNSLEALIALGNDPHG